MNGYEGQAFNAYIDTENTMKQQKIILTTKQNDDNWNIKDLDKIILSYHFEKDVSGGTYNYG